MNKLNEKITADLFLIFGFNSLSFRDENQAKLKTRISSLRNINKIALDDELGEILRKWMNNTRAFLSHSKEKLLQEVREEKLNPEKKSTISNFEESIRNDYLVKIYENNKGKIVSANKDWLYAEINCLFKKYLDNEELEFRLESLAILSMAFFLYKFELSALLNPKNLDLQLIFKNDPKIEEVLKLIFKEEVLTHTEIIGNKEFQTKYDDLQIRGWNLYKKISLSENLTPDKDTYSFFGISDIYTFLKLISKDDIEYFSSKNNFLLEENYGLSILNEEDKLKELNSYKKPNVINYEKLAENKIYFIKISNNEFNLFFYANNLKKDYLRNNLLSEVNDLKHGKESVKNDDDSFLKNYKDNKLKWYTIHFNTKNIFSFLDKNNLLTEQKKSLLSILQQESKNNLEQKISKFKRTKDDLQLTDKQIIQPSLMKPTSEISANFLKDFLKITLKDLGTRIGYGNNEETEQIKIDKNSIDQFYLHFYGDLNLCLQKEQKSYTDIVNFQPYTQQIVELTVKSIRTVFGHFFRVENFIKDFFKQNDDYQTINQIYSKLILEKQKTKQKIINDKNNNKVYYKAYLSSFIYLAYPNKPGYEINKEALEKCLLNNLLTFNNKNSDLIYLREKQELTITLKNKQKISFKKLELPINREAIKIIAQIFNREVKLKESGKNYEFRYSNINRSKFLMMAKHTKDAKVDLIQFLSNDDLTNFIIWVRNKRDTSKEKEIELDAIMHSRFIDSEVYSEFEKTVKS